ncbi:MAG: CARDB domain-containing protein [Chloroflexota bacterium]
MSWTPENSSAGSRVTFTATVRNQGTKRAGVSFLDFYVDGNSRGRTDIFGIDAGTNVTRTFTWVAVSGTHSLQATADLLGQVAESDESNNNLSATYATAAPDLVISSMTYTPASPTENTTVTFTVTVKNQGSGKASPSDLAFYIDNSLQATSFVSSLDPTATATRTFTWTAENRSQTVRAVADLADVVRESDESNNAMTLGLPTIAPDLIIESITWSPSPPLISHQTTFTVTVKNQGKTGAGFSRLYFHISGAHSLHEYTAEIPEIAAGDTATRTFTWTSPDASQNFVAVIDGDNYIFESNESNNTMSKTVVFSPPTPTADLIVQSITCAPPGPTLGDTVTITATVKNQGTRLANPSHLAYYVDDTLLATVYIDQLNAGETDTVTADWRARAGPHTVRAVADVNNAVAETDETNNEKAVTIAVTAPDLVVQNAAWWPVSPKQGDEVSFSVTIRNRGDYRAGSSYLYYYVDDIFRGSHYVEEIAPGNTVTKDFTWQAHEEPHSFLVVVDGINTVAESDESNNSRGSALPAPDLVIEGISWSPENPTENATVTFTVTVSTTGGNLAGSPNVAFYVDDILQEKASVIPLGLQGTATGTFTWTAATGQHLFRAVADEGGAVIESNESNNVKWISLDVTTRPAAVALPSPAPGPAPAGTAELKEPEAGTPAVVAVSEPPPAPDDTSDEDIAGKIAAETAAPWWQGILMNRWFIIGLGGAGAAAVLVLLRFRKRQSESE